jgi:transcription antitermination factor NusG
VRVTAPGPWLSREGLLTEVDEVRGVVRVQFTIRGRPVPLEVATTEIELVGASRE